MKPRSAKNKGTRYENFLVDLIRRELDPKAHRTYGSGSGLDKNDIRLPKYDIEIEAKNQKTIKILDWFEQAERQGTTGNRGIVVFRNPRKPEFHQNLAVCDLNDLLVLIAQTAAHGALQGDPRPHTRRTQETPNRELTYQIQRLVVEAKKTIKALEDEPE